MTEGITVVTFEQMEALLDVKLPALLKKELTPLKEAISSMEAKLGDHEASLEDVSRRPEVLEFAPADEKVKSAASTEMKVLEDSIPGQVAQIIEDKIAVSHDQINDQDDGD